MGIEVRSIAHVVYDGHDVPVSVMHDEGPRRGPVLPGGAAAAESGARAAHPPGREPVRVVKEVHLAHAMPYHGTRIEERAPGKVEDESRIDS